MNTGIKGLRETVVSENNTAECIGSGTLRVFATPAMVALIEETAWRSVAPLLEEGYGTVGTLVNISHMAPTPLGGRIKCETELIETDNRRLVFSATVSDDNGIIGKGIHERFIINNDKFMKKATGKL